MFNYTAAFLGTLALGEVLLLVGGWLLSAAEGSLGSEYSFFHYRFQALGSVPAWLVLALLLVFANGIWMARLAQSEIVVRTPGRSDDGRYSAEYRQNPVRLLGQNLALVPALLAAFYLFRGFGL